MKQLPFPCEVKVTRFGLLHMLNVKKEIKGNPEPQEEINSPDSRHLVNQKVSKFELGQQT